MNSDISWGQQVTVMFQIVSTMALELPSFLGELEELRGMSPNVQLQCEPWGHNNHEDIDCECQASDRMAAYVYDLCSYHMAPAKPTVCHRVVNFVRTVEHGEGTRRGVERSVNTLVAR